MVSKVAWGELGYQGDPSVFTPGSPGERGDGLLLFQKLGGGLSQTQNLNQMQNLTQNPIGAIPQKSSSSSSSSSLPQPLPQPIDWNGDMSVGSGAGTGVGVGVGSGVGVPVLFEWKGVKGSCTLHLATTHGRPIQPSSWSIQHKGMVTTENNDKGREMVTMMLRSLAKSVYELHRGERKRRLLLTQRAIIRKQK